MPAKCLACAAIIQRGEMLLCSRCDGTYHYGCLNISSAEYQSNSESLKNNWRCPNCNRATQRSKRDDTPVKSHIQSSTTSHCDMSCEEVSCERASSLSAELPSMDKISHLLDLKLSNISNEISTKFDKLYATVETLKTDLIHTTDFLAQQLKDCKQEVCDMRSKVVQLENQTSKLQAELQVLKKLNSDHPGKMMAIVEELRSEFNDKEQASLLNDIEISGIPESNGESLFHLAIAVGAKFGVILKDQDLVTAYRAGPKRIFKNNDGGEKEQDYRPRPVVVRLARRVLRDEFIKQARLRRGTLSTELGLPSHKPRSIYINERLTRPNREILYKAREARKEKNWKYVWSREGRIYARKTEHTQVFSLRSLEDVNQVFNNNTLKVT